MKTRIIIILTCIVLLLSSSCMDKAMTNPKDPMENTGWAELSFSPSGGVYYTNQSVTILSTSPGVAICYTTDGTNPTEGSPLYSSPISVSANTTLKARAFNKDWKPSSILTANYNMTVTKPAFNPPGGVYDGNQSVTISCATPGANIYYSTNGSTPSVLYTGPVSITPPMTLKATAKKTGWNDSQTTSEDYAQKQTVATPTFNPAGGTYSNNQSVTISCATPGSTIYYSTDGSTPATLYTGPVSITGNMSLKAKATKTGWKDSQIASTTYSFSVATPTFNPPGGSYTSNQNVTINCATSGATIRYTTNGSDPTESSSQYTYSIAISSSTTIKAKAFRSGWASSSTASAAYIITPIQMVYVPGGTFTMGRTKGDGYSSDELPTHSVTLNSFYIGKYQVTQSEYQAVMGSNPASGYGVGANYPVYYVSWYSAIKYCNLLSMNEGRTPVYSISGSTNPANWGSVPTSNNSTWNAAICNWTANGYRLPTEAEWEYAARGATNNPDYLYSGSDTINPVAWYYDNSGSSSHIVGTKANNGRGIYDMSGNLYECCWDWYNSTYYSSSPSTNPRGPTSGSYRVLRGGYWFNYATVCRVADRGISSPNVADNYIGFRLCRAGS